MKTYVKCLVLLAFFAVSCTSTEETPVNDDDQPNIDADYAMLFTNNGILSSGLLKADGESISLDPGNTPFSNAEAPELSYRQDMEWSFYHSKTDCTGEITKFDFNNFASSMISVFEDLSNCELSVKGIAHSDDAFYLAYSLPGSGLKEFDYFVRIIDLTESEPVVTDVSLAKAPEQLIFSNQRVFIFSRETNEDYSLVVLDTQTAQLIHDLNLDDEALMMFKTIDGHIMISYPELHLIVNSTSMAITSTVRYDDGKEPKFGFNALSYFDPSGNLYYSRPTDLEGTEYANIPGVYDFESNTAILYFYENFLTEEERRFEFEIADTSMVSYDSHNNLILIGYRKSGDSNLGGLLRIRPIPEPAFIDNIDLPGVPLEVFIE